MAVDATSCTQSPATSGGESRERDEAVRDCRCPGLPQREHCLPRHRGGRSQSGAEARNPSVGRPMELGGRDGRGHDRRAAQRDPVLQRNRRHRAILGRRLTLVAQGLTAELDAGPRFDAGVQTASEYQSDTGELRPSLSMERHQLGPVVRDGRVRTQRRHLGLAHAERERFGWRAPAHGGSYSHSTSVEYPHGFDNLSLSLSVRRPSTRDLLRYDGNAWVGFPVIRNPSRRAAARALLHRRAAPTRL